MTGQFAKIQELFTKARGLSPEERLAYFRKACPDARLRTRVEDLLKQHDSGEDFLGVHTSIGQKNVSHYRVGKTIGSGGLALVYRAYDTLLKRPAALKILQAWASSSPQWQERLIDEAKQVSSLNHPNIVTVYEILQHDDRWVIAMEYLPGMTLDVAVPKKGFPVRTAFRYALQMSDALAAAEKKRILHGDLKPANVMVTEHEQTKLLDFGLARTRLQKGAMGRDAPPWTLFGTKRYMAPERLKNRRRSPDTRSEVFSFGLVLHEMLSGRHAFDAGSDALIVEAIQSVPPHPLPSKVPEELAKIVHRCLTKNPARRFESFQRVHDALRRYANTHGLKIHEYRSPKATRPAARPTALLRRARTLLARLTYQNVAKSREALNELNEILRNRPPLPIRKVIAAGSRELILSLDFGTPHPSEAARELRQAALAVLKSASGGQLRKTFEVRDLEYLDLYGMDFSGADLQGLSLKGCFLVEANFTGCNLTDVSLAEAYIRNARFESAVVTDADFSNADWFNALALTPAQRRSVRRDTLMACPATLRALHHYLRNRYGFPFDSWGSRVQDELLAAWRTSLPAN